MLDIFIIGPMGSAGGKNNNIKEALILIFNDLEYNIPFNIKTPDELFGGEITSNVFYEMDALDLVIADITGRSPNVFYEIAILNSMGKPMVILDSHEKDELPIPFYLKNTNLAITPNREITTLEKELKSFISRFFDPKEFTNYSASVISQYYGLPLVDISAVMGVAFGYYTNFVKPFLKRNTGAIAIQDNGVSALYVIVPKHLSAEDDCKKDLTRLLEDSKEKHFKCPESTRKKLYCPFVKGEQAYDIPSALFTLRKSPRFKKLKKKLSELQNLNAKYRVDAQKKYETFVIEKFFNHLEYLIQEEAEDLSGTYKFVTLEELKAD